MAVVFLRDFFPDGQCITISAMSTYPNLQLDFCGMSFATPLVLLSGCVGFGEEYTRIQGFSHSEVGAVCLKGTTLEPRLGNPHIGCLRPRPVC